MVLALREKVIAPSESLVAVTMPVPPTAALPGAVTLSRGVPLPTVIVWSTLTAFQSASPAWRAVTTQGPAWVNRTVVPVTAHALEVLLNVMSSPAFVVACKGESVPTLAPVTGVKSMVWSPLAMAIVWSVVVPFQSTLPSCCAVTTHGTACAKLTVDSSTVHEVSFVANVTSRPALLVACKGALVPTLAPRTGVKSMV